MKGAKANKQNGHKNATTKLYQCVCMERVSSMNEEEVYLSRDTPRAQVCPMSLTTLPAPPTDILIRKTSRERIRQTEWEGRHTRRDGRICVYCRRNERYTEAYSGAERFGGGGSVMSWGGVSQHHRTELAVIAENLNAVHYREDILLPHGT